MTMKGKDGAENGILGTHCETFNKFTLKIVADLECPPCGLSVLRQTGLRAYMPDYDYAEEMKKYFAKKNEEDMVDEYNAMLWEGIR